MKTSVIDLGLTWAEQELAAQISALFAQKASSSFIINTSGSTGITKRVEISATALSNSADLSNSALGAKAGDIWSLLLPTNHVAGLNVLARAIKLGTSVVSVEDRAEFTSIVPTQLHEALNGDTELLAHLEACKAVLVGGAATAPELLKEATKKGIKVVTTYGMTETCGGFIYNNIALPGFLVALNEFGQLKIKGPTLASGYLNQEDKWSQVFSDGWFTTNDLAEIRGDSVYILGRVDDIIISGGENISLKSLEDLLKANFPHTNFLATGIADAKWGQKLALISDRELSFDEIVKVIEKSLGRHCIPKEFLIVENIPNTALGKPDRVKAQLLFTDKQR
ncbi:MAG: AMP-binding protein [SAR202 cluster bacterium]|nr:AMP-binding protein [SAR202 cluster bacterium]